MFFRLLTSISVAFYQSNLIAFNYNYSRAQGRDYLSDTLFENKK